MLCLVHNLIKVLLSRSRRSQISQSYKPYKNFLHRILSKQEEKRRNRTIYLYPFSKLAIYLHRFSRNPHVTHGFKWRFAVPNFIQIRP
jgi:hypothetical protein